jgi:hypothetical protein
MAGERSSAGERAEEIRDTFVLKPTRGVVGIDDHLADGVDS